MSTDKENFSFGKRYGFEPIEIPFQLNDMNKVLRTELWNAFYIYIGTGLEHHDYNTKVSYRSIFKTIWIHFFKEALDDFPDYDHQTISYTKNQIENGKWYRVYEFFEFIFSNIKSSNLYSVADLKSYINVKLKENHSGYSLTGNKFIPIINEVEINELKLTQENAKVYKLSGVQEHLNRAIELISLKPKPDVHNCIKESISMVEGISRLIEPTENTLGKALNKLSQNQKISNTLKIGFEKLYAYSNGKNGIRHALMDEESFVDFEDAKFFLIACSAFTNYLIEKAKKDNILKLD